MANGRFIGYFRVSTERQGKSGLGLEAQQEAVRQYLNGGSWSMLAEFVEVESGRRNDRPELAKALSLARATGACLVIAKMDRLARNAHFLLGLKEAGIEFVAVDQPNANRLTVGILALVAEDEAERISARTKAALQAAKARGVRLGDDGNNLANRAVGTATSAAVRQAKAAKRVADLQSILADLKASGITSASAIAKALNAQGIPAARGGAWQTVQVQRLLQRAL